MDKRTLIPRIVMLVVTMLLCGCAAPKDVSPTIQPTEIPAPTNQPTEIPTPTVQPTEISTFDVEFDGDECIATVPTQLPLGKYSFVFTNNSDIEGELWLVYLKDGKTFQDLIDLQSEPGEWDPKPSWANYANRGTVKTQELSGKEVVVSNWNLDKEAEFIILCYIPSPQMIYYAGPVMVVKSSSD